MLKKFIILFISFTIIALFGSFVYASINNSKLQGKLLLQVESRGEIWYVNPKDGKRYFLNNFQDIDYLIEKNTIDFGNIPIEYLPYEGQDTDRDGLIDNFEIIIGSDPNNIDTDNDGYDDYTEIINNYNPLKSYEKLNYFKNIQLISGKIFKDKNDKNVFWYINPTTQKKVFISNEKDLLLIKKKLSLGIKNQDLFKIVIGNNTNNQIKTNNVSGDNIIYLTAEAIRKKDKNLAVSYFVPEMKKNIEYTMDFLGEDRLILGNILSSAILQSQNENEKIFVAYVYFQGEKIQQKYIIKKQPDGSWKMTNL